MKSFYQMWLEAVRSQGLVTSRQQALDVLQISNPNPTVDEVRDAMRKMSKLYHPDLHPGATPEERGQLMYKQKLINSAFDFLSDEEPRPYNPPTSARTRPSSTARPTSSSSSRAGTGAGRSGPRRPSGSGPRPEDEGWGGARTYRHSGSAAEDRWRSEPKPTEDFEWDDAEYSKAAWRDIMGGLKTPVNEDDEMVWIQFLPTAARVCLKSGNDQFIKKWRPYAASLQPFLEKFCRRNLETFNKIYEKEPFNRTWYDNLIAESKRWLPFFRLERASLSPEVSKLAESWMNEINESLTGIQPNQEELRVLNVLPTSAFIRKRQRELRKRIFG